MYSDKGVSGFSRPGLVQRDLRSPERSPVGGGGRPGNLPPPEGGVLMRTGERVMLRKTVSIDEQLLQVGGREQPHLRLWRRWDRGHKKACSVQVSAGLLEVAGGGGAGVPYDFMTVLFGVTYEFYSSAFRVSRPSPEGSGPAGFSVLPFRKRFGGIPR